jgi:hypothetical protein
MNNFIEATILNGKFKGEDVLLPRIRMIPTDMSFEFKRLQCATHFCNDHEQSTKNIVDTQVCGLNLKNRCFSNGQLIGLAHALENDPIYVCTRINRKEKQNYCTFKSSSINTIKTK